MNAFLDISSAIAPWWEIALAKIFGSQFVYAESEGVIKGVRWNGCIYITEWIPA